MSERKKEIPFEEVIKQVLLSNRKRPYYVESAYTNIVVLITGECPQSPLPEEPVYKALMFGYGLNYDVEDVKKLSKKELARELWLMESEDQDALVRLLPNFENKFWRLVESGRHIDR